MRRIYIKEIIEFLSLKKIKFEIKGNQTMWIDSYSALNSLLDRKISWIKYWTEDSIKKLEGKKGIVIIGRFLDAIEPEEENCFILCEDPKMCFFEILNEFFYEKNDKVISKTSIIHTNNIGKECSIGEFSVLGEEVTLGNNVIVGNHVILQGKVTVGNSCIIDSGTVIGKSGFGFYHDQRGHMKRVPHLGGVTIGDFVEIGANTCIDCGTMDDTIIGNYCKIDNLCHIGHNVHLGHDVIVVTGSAICGSCIIGDGSYISPGVVIKNQTHIGEGSFIGMQTAVIKDMKSESSVFGVPGKPFKREYMV